MTELNLTEYLEKEDMIFNNIYQWPHFFHTYSGLKSVIQKKKNCVKLERHNVILFGKRVFTNVTTLMFKMRSHWIRMCPKSKENVS